MQADPTDSTAKQFIDQDQPIRSDDEWWLLFWASLYRSTFVIYVLAVPTFILGAVYLAWLTFRDNPVQVRQIKEWVPLISTVFALYMILSGVSAFRMVRAILGLWGRSSSSLPWPIPQRSELIALACLPPVLTIILGFIVYVERHLNQGLRLSPTVILVSMFSMVLFGLVVMQVMAGWRARTLLDTIDLVPHLSLVEEPPPNWLQRLLFGKSDPSSSNHDEAPGDE